MGRDGVSWGVDLDAKPGKITEATSALDRMERSLDRIDKSTERIAGHFDNVGEHAKKAGEHGHGMFKEMLGAELAEKAIEKLTEKVIELGKEAVEAALSEERMLRVFEANFGSKEAGEAAEAWADALAAKTELSEKQTEGALIGMKRVGATDQQAKLAAKAAADVAAVSENRDEAFAATMSAFERIERTGQVSSRALAPLGLGVKDFKSLDSMKGLSDKAIKKKMEEGKVDKNDLFRLIMSHTGEKAIGERAANVADTLGTKLAKLQQLPERFFKKLAEGSAINVLAGNLGKALEKLDPDSPVGKKISGFLDAAMTAAAAAVGYLGDKLDGIDFDQLADTVKSDVVPAIQMMADAIGPTVAAIERVVRGFHEMHDIVMGSETRESAATRIGRGFRRLGHLATGDVAGDLAIQMEAPQFKQRAATKAAAVPGFDMEAEAAHAANGARAAAPDFVMAGEAWGKSVEKGYRAATKTHSPSVLFEDMGAMAAAGFARGVERSSGRVDNAIDDAFRSPARAPIASPAPAAAASGPISIGPFYLTIPAGAGAADGKAAADAFEARAREVFVGLLEEMRAGGAA